MVGQKTLNVIIRKKMTTVDVRDHPEQSPSKKDTLVIFGYCTKFGIFQTEIGSILQKESA
jgi:hypothetical protein